MLRSEPADRSEVERDNVEVGLVRLGVLDIEDASSPRASRCELVSMGLKLALSILSAPLEKSSEGPKNSVRPTAPA